MTLKVLKTEADYQRARARLKELMNSAPEGDCDELELLSTLIDVYERKQFPIELPNPIAAIRFRMEQAGLKPKDLAPYIGSRAKVSEVLSGSRPLSLSMIKALHTGLGIPAEALLSESDQMPIGNPEKVELDPADFPWADMIKRGWLQEFSGSVRDAKTHAHDLFTTFFGSLEHSQQFARYRRHQGRGAQVDSNALLAWTCRVGQRAAADPLSTKFSPSILDDEFTRRLTELSYLSDGPRLAQEFLRKNGIHLIIEPHLPKTRVDGAATLLSDGTPVIGLSIRYDRLDNFWFCLFHELAHVKLHLPHVGGAWYLDDLDIKDEKSEEKEADSWAQDNLIAPHNWDAMRSATSAAEIEACARKARIHPAIVAGRVRRERNDYRLYYGLVGQGDVRRYFDGNWE